jgi:DNA-binding NarL/FixJ family response regulator
MENISIALIDDQVLFRQGLASLIKSVPGFELVAEADNGNNFLEQLSVMTDPPHIALMDMEMPGMNWIELNGILRKKYPGIKVIVLSVHASERLIARMIEAGASGYLLKNCDREELIKAINTVTVSGFYLNEQVLKAIQQTARQRKTVIKKVNNIPVDLSELEKEILILICKEYTNPQIAEKLFISVRTVEGHRNNLLAKTGCANTAGLVVFAIKNHIVDLIF